MNNNKSKFQLIKYDIAILLICVIVVAIDTIAKLITDGETLDGIPGFISIFSTHNFGGAWSIFSNATLVLTITSIALLVVILFFNAVYKDKSGLYTFAIGLVCGGAVGNIIDRVFLGYVRDFIKLEFMKFPVFNIADCAITIGTILLCIYFVIFTKKDKKQEKQNLEDKTDN